MDYSVKNIAITLSETAQWHALLGRAEYLSQQCLPEDVAHYLVRLFLLLTREDISGEQMLSQQDHAVSEPDEKLQRVADRCLLICGFYPDVTSVYEVAPEEFIKTGKNAYQTLAKHADIDAATVYTFLASNFDMVVDMLSRISQLSSANIQAVGNSTSAYSNGFEKTSRTSNTTQRLLVARQLN